MRESRDSYFIKMLELVCARSTCARRAVGAIITDEAGHVLATGYNGVPSGFDHCTDVACPGRFDVSGDTRRCLAVHAEQNALLQCHRLDLAHTLYVTCTPCFTCAKMILNTSVKRVVVTNVYADRLGLPLLIKHLSVFVFDFQFGVVHPIVIGENGEPTVS